MGINWSAVGRTFGRATKESVFPVIVAIGWTAYNYFSKEKNLADSLALGVSALAFTLYLQGQLLRVNKNIRDEDNYKALSNNIDDLKKLIADSARQVAIPEPPAPDPIADSFIDRAEAAVAANHVVPGLLLAA